MILYVSSDWNEDVWRYELSECVILDKDENT